MSYTHEKIHQPTILPPKLYYITILCHGRISQAERGKLRDNIHFFGAISILSLHNFQCYSRVKRAYDGGKIFPCHATVEIQGI